MFRYQAFGVPFELPFESATRLEAASAHPELVLVESLETPSAGEEVIYENPVLLADGAPSVVFTRSARGDTLRFTRAVEFRSPEAEQVDFTRLGDLVDSQIEAYVLASLIPYRLELGGLLALHCASVRNRLGVIGFLGHSGAGKSTLAGAVLARGGELVAEDILPVSVADNAIVARAGYPEMKLGLEAGSHIFGPRFAGLDGEPFGDKRRIPVAAEGWGGFAAGDHEPLAFFVLDRTACEQVHVERLSSRHAVLEVLRFSFHARLAEALGRAPERLERMVRLAERVPVFRLRYPSAYDRLDEICALVESPERWPAK